MVDSILNADLPSVNNYLYITKFIIMAKFINKNSIVISIWALVIIFIFLLAVGFPNDMVSKLSMAFTAVASIATVGTLVVALKLYDQYGLKNNFIQKQADKLFELIALLKGKSFTAHGEKETYFCTYN